MDNPVKTATFKFGLKGLVSKEDPALLRDGQYRSLVNCEVLQEGGIASRNGRKSLGNANLGVSLAYMVRKSHVSTIEDPSTPSGNLRYVGVNNGTASAGNLYRTTDYSTLTEVATKINTTLGTESKRFKVANYSAGSSGHPWAFIASELKMLKDNCASPYATGTGGQTGAGLRTWGITPAFGVAIADVSAYLDLASTIPVVYSTGTVNVDATGLIVTWASGTGLCTTGFYAGMAGHPINIGGTTCEVVSVYTTSTTDDTLILLAPLTSEEGQSGVAFSVSNAFLDGGSAFSPSGSTPYDYRACYIGADTGNQGNPSQTMLADSVAGVAGGYPVRGSDNTDQGTPINVHLQAVIVTVWGTGDQQVSQTVPSIAIYRRGGLLYDTWRLVGTVINPGLGGGGEPNSVSFIDNIPDTVLVYAQQIQLDNDPPVLSTVPTPLTTTISSGATAAGFSTISTTAAIFTLLTNLPGGTLMHFTDSSPEDVFIIAATTASTALIYCQYAHAALAPVEIDTITGQPCTLTDTNQQFTLVAGDPNNPHVLYRSKGDMPESFPIAPADGTVASIAVGSPSNPIMAFFGDFRGAIVCLNLLGIYETLIYNGSLLQPSQVAKKGLVSPEACCKTDNEIWFLSTDGVWSWDGGTCQKRSEAIDPIFHGQQLNGIPPLDFSNQSIIFPHIMAYRRGEICLLYLDVNGAYNMLICEPGFGDRWRLYTESPASSPPDGPSATTFIYTEPDTGTMVLSKAADPTEGPLFYFEDQEIITTGINYTSDGFTTDPTTQGVPIPIDMRLPWIDFASPHAKKLFEEVYLDLDISNTLGHGTSIPVLSVDLLFDYSDTAVYTVSVPLTLSGRSLVSLLPNLQNVASVFQSFGREGRAVSFRIYGAAYPSRMQFFNLIFRYQDTGILTAGAMSDWMDLGSKFDKRLYEMSVEFDVEGTNRTLIMDTITGVAGNTYNAAIQSFTLSNPTITGAGRALCTFPLADATIVKMVRIRQAATPVFSSGSYPAATAFFKIDSVDFQKEVYPADIVNCTPWDDGGYAYLKYLNQIFMEVNTNGVPVTVNAQADGAAKFTFVVTSTESDRQRFVTVPTGLTGYRWRLFVDVSQAAIVSGGGMFQLWNHSMKMEPADKGEVGHTFDWDDLGYSYDKYLRTVAVEYDNTSGANITLQMDTLSGIGGQTLNSNVASFTVSGGRTKVVFPVPINTIAKMIRLYPVGATIPAGFKQWKYKFEFDQYPPDIILSTQWKDAQNPDSKNPSWLWIDADTQSVAATVILQNESGTAMTVNHTGSATNRKVNYPIPVDIFAKMWRLLATPGTGGKFQNFDWGFARWQPTDEASGIDPPEAVLWTPWQQWGWPYGTTARNLILTINTGGVDCVIGLATQEAGVVQTFTVNTTYTTRKVVLACNAGLIGTQWRLLLTPGSGGLSQLWNWQMDVVKEPPAVTEWTSNPQGFGYRGWKIIKQVWLDYQCASPMTWTMVSDTGTFSITLPAHPVRAVERFYPPSVWGSGLDKSKLYTFSFAATDPLMMYADVSGIEWLAIGSDRHAEYKQTMLSEFLQMPI